MQDKIDALKTAHSSEDVGTIKSATEALSQTLMKIGEAMMKSQTPPPPPDGSGEPKDAEFKEKP